MDKENTICPAPTSCRDHHYPPLVDPDFLILVGTPPSTPTVSKHLQLYMLFICSVSDSAISGDLCYDLLVA